MGPLTHLGLTAGLLSIADLAGCVITPEIVAATVIGGVLIDGDKVFEIFSNKINKKKKRIPDITARSRILHSIFVWPFSFLLSFAVSSWVPFFAVLSHIFADSFILALEKDGKYYSSHSPRKWLANPFFEKSWAKVTVGWPVTYPPKFNWVYDKLDPAIGVTLLVSSVLYWFLK